MQVPLCLLVRLLQLILFSNCDQIHDASHIESEPLGASEGGYGKVPCIRKQKS